MKEKEFDELTPEEKSARFQKALDDYNSGFVEADYVLRSVASMRVEEAMENTGMVLEEFKPAYIVDTTEKILSLFTLIPS